MEPIKKDKVGKLTQKDVNRAVAKAAASEGIEDRNRSEKGKFVVSKEKDSYRFTLYAPQGKPLYASPLFRTKSAATDALIDFINSAALENNFSYRKLDDKYLFVLTGENTFASGLFPTKFSCKERVTAIVSIAPEAELKERQTVE